MNLQSEEVEVAPDVPVSQPKLTMVAILAALSGILLAIIAVGGWLLYQQRAVFDAEVLALKEALKNKNIALADQRAQNTSLAKQLKILKGYSIASSTAASEKPTAAEKAAPADPKPSAAPKAPASAKAKKTMPQDCELVGKTPEQQAATLQRCVSQIDTPPAKPRQ